MTIQFAKLGVPLNDNSFQVYLRYLHKDRWSGKNKYQYIPTGHYLQPTDFDLLISEKLGGKIAYQLYHYKEEITSAVNLYFETNKFYPDKDTILTKLKSKDKTTLEYISKYRQEIKKNIATTTYETYVNMIQNFVERMQKLEVIDKKQYLQDADLFATLPTLERIIQHHIDLGYKNGFLLPLKRLLTRMVNYIRLEKGLAIIEYKTKLKVTYSHLELTDQEVGYLLNHPVTKSKDIEAINLLKINSVLGLRINEVLSLHAEDIEFNSDHIMISITESKKTRERKIAVVNEDCMILFKTLCDRQKSGKLFSLNKDTLNYRIQRIAKETGKFDMLVKRIVNNGMDIKEERIPKYDCISTHSFRRYRITKNAKNNLMIAQYFSGHKNLNTIQKHYLGSITHDEIIEMLKK